MSATARTHHRPPGHQRRRLAGQLLGTVLLLAAAAGCAHNAASSSAPTVHTAAQAAAEYQAEIKILPALPNGATFPAPSISDHETDGTLDTYGPGFGNQIADSTWECIWIRKTIADTPHTPTYNADLATLATYRQTYIYIHQDLARQQFDPQLAAAENGLTDPLTAQYTDNCT